MHYKSIWLFHGRIFGLLLLLFATCGYASSSPLFAGEFDACNQYEQGVGDVFVCGSQLCRKKNFSSPGQENWCKIESFRSYQGKILDSQQQEFFIRGVNNPHAWFGDEALTALPSISSLGFNSVRVVWTLDLSADELATALDRVLQNKMIPILEFHDLTGRSDPNELMWLVDTMVSRYAYVLSGKEDRLMINIANEWGGNLLSHELWRDTYIKAVKKLRAAGINHLLIIDGTGWAQDPNGILKYGKQIYESDPLQNVVFSIHLYEKWRKKYAMKYSISENFARLKAAGLAVIVGEFAQQHDFHLDGSSTTICFNPINPAAQERYLADVFRNGYRPNQSDFEIDFKSIMQEAHRFGMGYLAWSWKGNGRSNACYLDYLDIANQWDVGSGANFQPNRLNVWGCELVKNLQAQPARIFGASDSPWARYQDLSCSTSGNFLSCNRFDGGYGASFACGDGRFCKKSTQDINQTDWAYWCAVDP